MEWLRSFFNSYGGFITAPFVYAYEHWSAIAAFILAVMQIIYLGLKIREKLRKGK